MIDEELLRKANNKFFIADEFNHALKDLMNRKYALYMHLNISSFTTIKNRVIATSCLI